MAVFLYYLIRVRKGSGKSFGERFAVFKKGEKKGDKVEKAELPRDEGEKVLT